MEGNILDLLGGKSTSGTDILKGFLTEDNINIKTDIDTDKLRILCRLKWHTERRKEENKDMTGLEIIQDKIVPYYLALRCSIGRKSRTEILDTLKEMNEKFMFEEKGLINLK